LPTFAPSSPPEKTRSFRIPWRRGSLVKRVPRCRLERLALDLGEHEPRRELLARLDASAERVLVLTEGLVPYLDLTQAGELADDLRAMPRLESWIVDYIAPGVHRHRERRLKRSDFPAFKFQPPDWHAFFAAHGFRARETRYLAEEGLRRGRRAPLPWFTRSMLALMPRQRRAELSRFAGYVLLEPSR
jgi:O-methyltransferase involved in polyketide biosynthesis